MQSGNENLDTIALEFARESHIASAKSSYLTTDGLIPAGVVLANWGRQP